MAQVFDKFFNLFKFSSFRNEVDRNVRIGKKCIVSEDFRPVYATFREMLSEESGGGLALCVLIDGELVVDLWGGYADRISGRLWEADTLTCTYSLAKCFGALTIGALNSRCLLNYEDLVAKHWPRFAQNGKATLTIDDILMHKAGLVAFHRDISLEEAEDGEIISTIIEELFLKITSAYRSAILFFKNCPFSKKLDSASNTPQNNIGNASPQFFKFPPPLESAPLWALATGASSYHAFTWGFLVDEIVRRVDPKGRNISKFLKQEICSNTTSGEFYIGLPEDEFPRATRQTRLTTWQKILAVMKAPMRYLMFAVFENFIANSLYKTTKTAIGFLRLDVETKYPYNNRQVVAVPNVGALGFGTARGIAKTAWRFFQKDDILSKEVKNLIKTPTEEARDIAVPLTSHRGHGFTYARHPIQRNRFIISAQGYGGQMMDVDAESKVVIVLLRNCIKPPQDPSNKLRYEHLRNQLYQIVYGL